MYINIVLKVHIYLRLVGKSSGVYMNIVLKVHIHLRLVGKSSGVYMNIVLKVHTVRVLILAQPNFSGNGLK